MTGITISPSCLVGMSPALPLTPVSLHVSLWQDLLCHLICLSVNRVGKIPFGTGHRLPHNHHKGCSGLFFFRAIARFCFAPVSSGSIVIDTPISNSRHIRHTCQIMARIICSSAHIADLSGARQKLSRNCIVSNATTISRTPGQHRRQRSRYFAASTQKIFSFFT